MPAANLALQPRPGLGPTMHPEYCTPDKPPASINEGVFETKIDFDEDVVAIREALQVGRVAAHKCHEIAEALLNDASRTEVGRHYDASQAIYRASSPAIGRMQTVVDRLAKKVVAMEETKGPAEPTNPVAFWKQMEVRNALSNLKPDERIKILRQAAETGDDATVGAVLRSPPWIAGIDELAQADVRQRWQKAKYPTEIARLETLKAASEHLERGQKLLLDYSLRLTAPVLVQRAKDAQQRTAKALGAE